MENSRQEGNGEGERVERQGKAAGRRRWVSR